MSNKELRAKGYTYPVSVLQIRAEVRAKYSKMSQSMMKAMLTPKSVCEKVIPLYACIVLC